MPKMTKSQLMAELAAKSGLTKKDVVSFMDLLMKTAYAQVRLGRVQQAIARATGR